MAGPTIEDGDAGALAWIGPRRRDVNGRLAVVCDSVAAVVSAAGGWLFDQGLVGSAAVVFLVDHADDRALRILGAAAVELESTLASELRNERPHTLMLAASLFRHDGRVRRAVRETIDEGVSNVIMWGDRLPDEFEQPVTVEHRLSIAARAFKKEALAAAGAAPDSAVLIETFSRVASGVPMTRRARDGELVPLRLPHDHAGGALDRLDRRCEVGIGSALADRVLP
jgi:hypothetical protein